MDRSSQARTVLVHEYVTGGGFAGQPPPTSWATEGAAMRRALAADFACLPNVRVLVTLDARFTPPRKPSRVEHVLVHPGEEQDTLARLAAEADFTIVVAPETGGILLARERIVAEAGGVWLGPSQDAITLTADKYRLGQHLAVRGIATPPARKFAPAHGLPADAHYPAVIKPVDGAGAVATFVLERPGPLPDELTALPEALLQPLVPGVAMSASFVVGQAGQIDLIGVGRQRFENCDGRLCYRGGTLPAGSPAHAAQARAAVAAVPGLRGFVGVDFIWNRSTRQATVLEINPRVTTSYVALSRLLPGGRLARAWLQAAAPGPAREILGAAREEGDELWRALHAIAPLYFEPSGRARKVRGELRELAWRSLPGNSAHSFGPRHWPVSRGLCS